MSCIQSFLCGFGRQRQTGAKPRSPVSLSSSADESKCEAKVTSGRSVGSGRKGQWVILHGWLRSRNGDAHSGDKIQYSKWKTRYWRLLLTSDGFLLQKSRDKKSEVYKSVLFPFGRCIAYESWGVTTDKEFKYGFTLRIGLKKCALLFEAAVRSAEARDTWFNILRKAYGSPKKDSLQLFEWFYLWHKRRSRRARDGSPTNSLDSRFAASQMELLNLRSPKSASIPTSASVTAARSRPFIYGLTESSSSPRHTPATFYSQMSLPRRHTNSSLSISTVTTATMRSTKSPVLNSCCIRSRTTPPTDSMESLASISVHGFADRFDESMHSSACVWDVINASDASLMSQH